MATPKIPKVPDDIDTKSPGLRKFFNITKTVAAAGGALVFLYAALGPLWTIPREIKENHQEIIRVESKTDANKKDIESLKIQVSEDKINITQMKKTIDEINAKQNTIHEQYTDLNKNIVELNTSLKFFKESIDEMKKEIKQNNN